ncbi:MAG: hypothetical protein A3I04_04605 [Nitrospinae bacterium RIFCSPLOWO2_02_FULL_39_110]|nr:MAG: hypothetical protein A2W53_04670 [Nitrospinae bacterium RIFCSPHIGHO2_02_39_11]OGW04411.1 MAG: hypothetical protein A2Z59_07030 [Nitrospinae bacterium RIFCSPLOWO2_02_39_17]OGW04865.1 MAG: hypothetical protein A3I04_04605 [Nitrospinae bacterium RIFCSPLOWO2_02_FULL_39_110]OGW09378.1 MAG: hypothetical protein A2W75_05825 [Nitrospinae bacterium RIFCSPLOWO2_12_39_15]
MTINYTVRADVIDIRSDSPRQDDLFLVDTNVWYWTTYSRANQSDARPKTYQINNYPAYIAKAISSKSQLCRCGLSFAELAHLIEKTELEIYSRTIGFDKTSKKEFRHNHSSQRANVVAEIQTAWSQVKIMAKAIDIQINESSTDNALSRLSTQQLDGYDLFILEAISRVGVVKIITDDGDYVTVPDIQVFTANQNVITAAQKQGKLIVR